MKIQVLLVAAAFATACSPADSKTAAGAKPGIGPAAAKAAPAPAAQRWTTFADPAERAFTLDVPAGWQVMGGSRRMSATEIRTGVMMRSPDNAIVLFYGDNDVPIFTVPNQLLAMGGFREGSVYSPGYGQQMVVMHYMPGPAFAADWGQRRFGCQAKAARMLPSATQAIDMAYANGGVRTSIKAGEATFLCNGRHQYAFAGTELVETGMGGGSLWDMKSLAAFDAAPGREAEASALLQRVAASFRVDQGWAARQQGLTASVSRIVADTNAAVSKSIADSFDYKNAVNAKAMNDFSQATRGVETFDTPNGPRELENAPHQWRLPDGRIVPTNGSNPPVQGAVELPRVK